MILATKITDFAISTVLNYNGNQIIKVTYAVSDGPYFQGARHYCDNADKQQECTYDANGQCLLKASAKPNLFDLCQAEQTSFI